MASQTQAAQQAFQQAKSEASEAGQQAARAQLQQIQAAQAAKLQQIAAEVQARIAAWERLKATSAPPATDGSPDNKPVPQR